MHLSEGQVQALKTGNKADGTPASKFYMNAIERTVKIKIMEACSGLREVHEMFPKYRSLIETGLSWMRAPPAQEAQREERPKKQQQPAKVKFPDLSSIESGDEERPDPATAFKGL